MFTSNAVYSDIEIHPLQEELHPNEYIVFQTFLLMVRSVQNMDTSTNEVKSNIFR